MATIFRVDNLNVAQLKALHKRELDRLLSMRARYSRMTVVQQGSVNGEQLKFAMDMQQDLLDTIVREVEKVEALLHKG